jgi:hypothetical protein
MSGVAVTLAVHAIPVGLLDPERVAPGSVSRHLEMLVNRIDVAEAVR